MDVEGLLRGSGTFVPYGDFWSTARPFRHEAENTVAQPVSVSANQLSADRLNKSDKSTNGRIYEVLLFVYLSDAGTSSESQN